ncbi:zinc finger protein ZFPM2 [Lates japonicus]|uniref:Zinc finger protein ZFPM2 n=1 Tax=Lates japonicus TaxID=270547 RepID=A0AAD3M7N7_LATJO|nr:zinc finger protein ZFPM2 [Lates japonicus]
MLEEPLRRMAMALCSPRKTKPAAVGPPPFTCSRRGMMGRGTWAMGPQLEGREGGVGSAAVLNTVASCHEGSSGPISRAWSGRAPNQPATAAGAAVNTCRLATTRTQAALPAEKES